MTLFYFHMFFLVHMWNCVMWNLHGRWQISCVFMCHVLFVHVEVLIPGWKKQITHESVFTFENVNSTTGNNFSFVKKINWPMIINVELTCEEVNFTRSHVSCFVLDMWKLLSMCEKKKPIAYWCRKCKFHKRKSSFKPTTCEKAQFTCDIIFSHAKRLVHMWK